MLVCSDQARRNCLLCCPCYFQRTLRFLRTQDAAIFIAQSFFLRNPDACPHANVALRLHLRFPLLSTTQHCTIESRSQSRSHVHRDGEHRPQRRLQHARSAPLCTQLACLASSNHAVNLSDFYPCHQTPQTWAPPLSAPASSVAAQQKASLPHSSCSLTWPQACSQEYQGL